MKMLIGLDNEKKKMKALYILLLFVLCALFYDPGGYEINGAGVFSGLLPTYNGANSTFLDLVVEYQDTCGLLSALRVSAEKDQCIRYVGINNVNPVCALDVNGTICLNGAPVNTGSPWTSTSFLILPAAVNTAQTFTPSLGTSVDIAFIHSTAKALTRAFSDSNIDYGTERGASAVDFQMNRSTTAQVAAARSSTILNGDRGEIAGSAEYCTILNGFEGYCGSRHGLLGNGRQNNISSAAGDYSSALNGEGNVVASTSECSTISNGKGGAILGAMAYGMINNGLNNQCQDSSYCFIGNGQLNSISGFSYNTILTGLSNSAIGSQSAVLGGSGTSVSGDSSSSVMCDGCTLSGSNSAILVGDSTLVRSDNSVSLYGFSNQIGTGGSNNAIGGNFMFMGNSVTYSHGFAFSSSINTGSKYCWIFGGNINIGNSGLRNMAFGDTVTIGASVTDSFAFGTSINIVRRQNVFAFGNDIVVTPTLLGSFVVQQLFGVGLRNGPNVGLFTAFGQYNNIANSYVGEERIFTYGIGGSLGSTANIWSLTNNGNMRISGSYLAGPAFNQASFFEHNLGTKLEPGTVVQLNYDDGTIEQCDLYTPAECFGVVTEVGAGFVGDAHEEEWHGKYVRTLHAEHHKKKLSPHYKPEQEYKPRSSRDEWHIVVTSGFIEIKNGEPVHPLWRAIPNKKNPPALEGYTWYHLRNI